MELSARRGLGLVLAFLSIGCSPAGSPTAIPTPPAFLPENPCELLTSEQVSSATGLQVTDRRRVPSIDETVGAQREDRQPPPGRLCSYETRSEYGAITVGLPLENERSAAAYWDARNAYFRDFPGSAQATPGLGQDAWIGGGNSLRVLVKDDVHFTLATQMYQPGSPEMLTRLAIAALGRFKS